MADDDTKDDVATEDTPGEEEKVEDVKEEAAEPSEPLQEPKGSSEPQTASSEDSESSSEGYQFDDDLSSSEPAEAPAATSQGGQGGGKYAEEIFTKTIHAKFRTFYVDLKESANGKFVKVSEKSKGRKSTIMMDAEDVPAMIEALQEVQKQL